MSADPFFVVHTRHWSPLLGRDVRFAIYAQAPTAEAAGKKVRAEGIPNGGRLFRIEAIRKKV